MEKHGEKWRKMETEKENGVQNGQKRGKLDSLLFVCSTKNYLPNYYWDSYRARSRSEREKLQDTPELLLLFCLDL